MSSGLGMATGCHAFIDVSQARIRHLSPPWQNGNVREISIGDEENLLLFTVYSYKDSKKIFWLSSSDYFEEKGEYNIIKNYTLNVKLIANAKVPKHPFGEKIEDIVSRAKQE